MGVCIALMLVGLSVFAIGVVKSVKSKCTDLTAVTWLWSGVALKISERFLQVHYSFIFTMSRKFARWIGGEPHERNPYRS